MSALFVSRQSRVFGLPRAQTSRRPPGLYIDYSDMRTYPQLLRQRITCTWYKRLRKEVGGKARVPDGPNVSNGPAKKRKLELRKEKQRNIGSMLGNFVQYDAG
jgi:hypothetical protein